MQEKEKRIADVMRSVPAWCTTSQSVQTVAEVMRDYGVHRVSVIDPETNLLLGTISERDLCLLVVAAGLDPHTTTAGEIMRRDPAVCVAEMDLFSARSLMVRQRAHQLPVVDDKKRLIGTVFLADLLGGSEAKLAKR